MPLAEGNRVMCSGRRGSVVSDRVVEALVHAEFLKSPYGAIRGVSCQMTDGVLKLTGCVPSYYLKQVAQRLALNGLQGVASIVNELQVEP
jgi:osmotically-inducible protein OsmY